MSSISKHVGWRIRMAREQQRVTQEYVAAALELSATGYRNIENGLTRISLDRLFQIGEILNIPVRCLLAEYPGFDEITNDNHHVSPENRALMQNEILTDAQRLKNLIAQLSQLLPQIPHNEKKEL